MLRKIRKIGAITKIGTKCTKFDFRWGSPTGELTALLRPQAVFKGPNILREGREKGGKVKGKGRGEEGEGKRGGK